MLLCVFSIPIAVCDRSLFASNRCVVVCCRRTIQTVTDVDSRSMAHVQLLPSTLWLLSTMMMMMLVMMMMMMMSAAWLPFPVFYATLAASPLPLPLLTYRPHWPLLTMRWSLRALAMLGRCHHYHWRPLSAIVSVVLLLRIHFQRSSEQLLSFGVGNVNDLHGCVSDEDWEKKDTKRRERERKRDGNMKIGWDFSVWFGCMSRMYEISQVAAILMTLFQYNSLGIYFPPASRNSLYFLFSVSTWHFPYILLASTKYFFSNEKAAPSASSMIQSCAVFVLWFTRYEKISYHWSYSADCYHLGYHPFVGRFVYDLFVDWWLNYVAETKSRVFCWLQIFHSHQWDIYLIFYYVFCFFCCMKWEQGKYKLISIGLLWWSFGVMFFGIMDW